MPRTTFLFVLWACGGAPDGRDNLVPDAPVGSVSRVAGREVWTERVGNGPFTRILARDARGTRELLRAGSADRAVLSPDGRWVAFVYAPAGTAAVGVVPFEGGAPIQLTNVGVERRKHAPGAPPEGFVPVPADASFVFVGGRLEWAGPDGPVSVRLPEVTP